MQDRKAPADKEKNGIQVPFKAAIKNSSRRPKKPTSKLKIIPLGGLEQIGMISQHLNMKTALLW